MSAILDLYDVYNFETYINGFLDLEYPNFDPKHGFLSSVEAEIISFCQRRQPFAFYKPNKHFISQKLWYYTVYVSHLGFLSPASI